MAFAAVATLFAATTVTVPMVLAAMAQVGTVMSVVGLVTGNKDLAKLGGAIGLVGGVGGLIAGAASAASSGVAGNLAQEGFRAGESLAQNAATDVTIDAGAAGLTAPEVTNFAATPGISEAQAVPDVGNVGMSPPPNTPAPLPTDVAGPTTVTGPKDVGARFTTNPAAFTGSAKGRGFFSGVFDYIKDPANKEMVNMGGKVIGGAFEGMQRADEFNRTQGLRENEFAYRQAQDANVRQQNTSRSGIIQRARA